MGGRGSSGASTYQALNVAPVPTLTMAQAVNGSAFSAEDDSDYHQLYNGRKYFMDQGLTIDQQMAVVNYLSDTTETGSLYSMSQNMNYALQTGKPLTANQQYVYDNLMSSMHNLGYNLNLTRYDHASMVDRLIQEAGLSGSYANYTQAQLKAALTGRQFTDKRFLSTSYNNFVNAPASAQSTFLTRAVKVSYRAAAAAQAMMPGNGPGGSLGEIILAPGQRQKVVDVKYTGKTARRQGTQSYSLPQVEIVVEVG